MKPRQLYPDLVDTAPETVAVEAEIDAAAKRLGEHINASLRTPQPALAWHQGENRRTRRSEVAKFSGPKELGKGLRRKLLKQRQKRALGKMDVALRRLQRKAAEK